MAVDAGQIASNVWSYVIGQCTAFVAGVATWIPAGLGNANTWVERARAKGYTISQVPVVGSVVQYAGPGFSQFGHVAYVTAVDADQRGFNVREMNFSCGPFCEDVRHSTMSGVQGFILPPGASVPAGISPQINPIVGVSQALLPGGALLAPFKVPDLQDLFVRAGLIILGIILVVVGILILFQRQERQVATIAATRGMAAAA